MKTMTISDKNYHNYMIVCVHIHTLAAGYTKWLQCSVHITPVAGYNYSVHIHCSCILYLQCTLFHTSYSMLEIHGATKHG